MYIGSLTHPLAYFRAPSVYLCHFNVASDLSRNTCNTFLEQRMSITPTSPAKVSFGVRLERPTFRAVLVLGVFLHPSYGNICAVPRQDFPRTLFKGRLKQTRSMTDLSKPFEWANR